MVGRWGSGKVRVVWLVVACLLVLVGSLAGIALVMRSAMGLYTVSSCSMAPTLVEGDRVSANKLAYRRESPMSGDIVVYYPARGVLATIPKDAVFVHRVIGVPGNTIRVARGYIRVGKREWGHQELKSALGGAKSIKFQADGVFAEGKRVAPAQIAKALGERPKAPVNVVPGRVYRNGNVLSEDYTAEDCDVDYPNERTDKALIKKVDGVGVVKIPEGYVLLMGDNRNDANDSRYQGLTPVGNVIGKVAAILYPESRARSFE